MRKLLIQMQLAPELEGFISTLLVKEVEGRSGAAIEQWWLALQPWAMKWKGNQSSYYHAYPSIAAASLITGHVND